MYFSVILSNTLHTFEKVHLNSFNIFFSFQVEETKSIDSTDKVTFIFEKNIYYTKKKFIAHLCYFSWMTRNIRYFTKTQSVRLNQFFVQWWNKHSLTSMKTNARFHDFHGKFVDSVRSTEYIYSIYLFAFWCISFLKDIKRIA